MISEITRRWIGAMADLERRHAAKGRRILDTIGDNPDGRVAEKVREHEATASDCDLFLEVDALLDGDARFRDALAEARDRAAGADAEPDLTPPDAQDAAEEATTDEH